MAARLKIGVDVPNAQLRLDKKEVRRVMRKAGQEIAALAKAEMRASKGGRVYYKQGSRVASAPGDAPAVQTKRLMQSIKVRPFKSGLGVAVRATEFYALFLESGAEGGSPRGGGTSSDGKRLGVRNKYAKRGGKRVKVATVGKRVLLPRPYLSRALAARERGLAERVGRAIEHGIAFEKLPAGRKRLPKAKLAVG